MMKRCILGRRCKVLSLGFTMTSLLASGCAPSHFGPAIVYWAKKAAVTDASARHTKVSPYYRFDTALLSDLDEAIACENPSLQREKARSVLKKANALALSSMTNEIERMPGEIRAKLAGENESSEALQHRLRRVADATLERNLQEIEKLGFSELRKKLHVIRNGVEDLPDDRGRMMREAVLFWGIIPTARGIAREESHLPSKVLAKASKKFERVELWHPARTPRSSILSKYAPIIGVERRRSLPYSVSSDRIGEVTLDGSPGAIDVRVDPAHPKVYARLSHAKIHGNLYKQLNYVWWFPDRPALSKNDVGAGKIDGAMLRITLDSNDRPAIIETSLNCGCGHGVFVSSKLESAAHERFGEPLPGKRFSVERDFPGKYDVVVIDTFDPPVGVLRPLVLTSSGYHEVIQVKFDVLATMASMEIVQETPYELADYDILDALPLGDGIASMFGPDGLVHGAGRPEGYLLAPSGILSAGQPRKLGTQRIRWDDYLEDDPHLLEKTLRLPSLD